MTKVWVVTSVHTDNGMTGPGISLHMQKAKAAAEARRRIKVLYEEYPKADCKWGNRARMKWLSTTYAYGYVRDNDNVGVDVEIHCEWLRENT